MAAPKPVPTTQLNLDNIQGNIFGGFNKDYETLLFITFKSAVAGRAWVAEIVDSDLGVASSNCTKVLKFNAQFKALRAAGVQPEGIIAAAWTNLGVSHKGLKALGLKPASLAAFPADFREGMAARNIKIGDVGASDPTQWTAPFKSPADVHAVLIVAADAEDLLTDRVNAIMATAAFAGGCTIIDQEIVQGRTRIDEPGHEHFGFKDGVSQPGIRGVTGRDDPLGNPDQGQPGQDLLWPGEFVLGYATQFGAADPEAPGLNTQPGPDSANGPEWARDGSYLVFRRLAQDVPAFRVHVETLAQQNNLSHDLMGAKLVGRYKSGCPLETRSFEPKALEQSPSDPGRRIPALANSDTLNNNFEFDEDTNGAICPIASHIRKAYPRNEQTRERDANGESENETQTHRLLRRGIPFGNSFGTSPTGGVDDPRGLLFMCYQKSIEQQFEFVQSSWVNDPQFPGFPAGRPTPGVDPIISQSPDGEFNLDPAKPNIKVKHFVTTTGGEYFFTPSILALQQLGAGAL